MSSPSVWYCIIPRHTSDQIPSLPEQAGCTRINSILSSRHHHNDAVALPRKYDRDCRHSRRYYRLLILQCHSEGVLWKELLPLLMPTATSSVNKSTALAHFPEDSPLDEPGAVPLAYNCSKEDAVITITEASSENYCGQCLSGKRRKEKNECATAIHFRQEKIASTMSRKSSLALSILMDHYQNCVRLVEMLPIIGSDDDDVEGEGVSRINSVDNKGNGSEDNKRSHHINPASDWYTQCHNIPDTNHVSDNIPTILLLMPPNTHQYYSRTPATSPTNPFTLRLIHHENTAIRLTSLSAYISTLGGGFFLCHYLSTAISLARQQCAIAILRGDRDMALKCRINEGYCYIHAGELKMGKRVIRRVLRDVMQLRNEQGDTDGEEESGLFMLHHTPERELSELTVIRNMCLSALRFANLIRDASPSVGEEKESDGESLEHLDGLRQSESSGCINDEITKVKKNISSTHDDFQRIRIVQDRKWR